MTRRTMQHHPTIGYQFVPSMKARLPRPNGGGYLIRTNSAGFRCDHEFEAVRPTGTRRVILSGDSFTAGDGVSNGKRFGDVIERELSSRLGPTQVYNLGLPGTGTDQQYLAWSETAKQLEADALVIAVLVENIRRVAAHYRYYADAEGVRRCYPKPYFVLENDHLTLHGVPVPPQPVEETALSDEERALVDRGVGGDHGRLKALAIRLGMKEVAQRVLRFDPVPEYREPDGRAWQTMHAILKSWIAEIRVPVLLVSIPLYQHVEGISSPRHYQARFNELVAETGVNYVDLYPELTDMPVAERKMLRFPSDNHLTERGHEVVGGVLARRLQTVLGGSE